MANDKIRLELFLAKTKQWELAKLMGVSEMTVIRRLREELPEEEQERIIKLIRQHAKEEAKT